MKEYILAYTTTNIAEGKQFIGWPLHMTLMPWFVLGESLEEVQIRLAEAIAEHPPIATRVLGEAFYGPRKNVPVVELEYTPGMKRLHNHILKVLEEVGCDVAAKRYTGSGFHPHITKKRWVKLEVGAEILIDKVYLVEAPIADPRTRIKTVQTPLVLGGVDA